jgi:hypothetical protein
VGLSVLPVIVGRHEVTSATPQDMERFTKAIVEAGTQTFLTAKGYQLKPGIKAERLMVGHRPAISCTGELIDAKGRTVSLEWLVIPLDSASVLASFTWVDAPGNRWKTVAQHASDSLRIGEKIAVSVP